MKAPWIAEWMWVVCDDWEQLHHPADVEDADALDDGEETEATLSCGGKVLVTLPGVFTRMAADRCEKCCEAVGFPSGVGSPKNDKALRVVLTERFGASEPPPLEQQYDIEEASDGGQ